MQRPLTRQHIRYCLATLKRTLRAFDRRYGAKIMFINDISFYHHFHTYPLSSALHSVKEKPGVTPAEPPLWSDLWEPHDTQLKKVDDILDILEPFMPLTLNEENFDLFLRATREMEKRPDTTPEDQDLPDYFTRKARFDFVVRLRQTESPEQWEWLLNVCDTLRDIKEQLEMICE